MTSYVPPGWPKSVHPPGTEGFQETATAWLLDQLPPECRQHEVLRRYPAALAFMARRHAEASAEGARQAYRSLRRDVAEYVPPHAQDGALAALRAEGFRLAAAARGAGLVERALRGEEFPARMQL